MKVSIVFCFINWLLFGLDNNTYLPVSPVFSELTGISATSSNSLGVKRELIMLSLPAIAGQALDPLAQLMETAYIGRLGQFII